MTCILWVVEGKMAWATKKSSNVHGNSYLLNKLSRLSIQTVSFEWAKKGPHDFNQRKDGDIWTGFEGWVGFKLCVWGGADFYKLSSSRSALGPWKVRNNSHQERVSIRLPLCEALFSRGGVRRSPPATFRLQPWPCWALRVTRTKPTIINLATCFCSLLWQDNAIRREVIKKQFCSSKLKVTNLAFPK